MGRAQKVADVVDSRHHHRSDEPTVRAKPTDLSPPLEHRSSPPFPLGMSGDHGAAQRVCDVCLRKWSPASPPPVIGEEQWTPDTRQCESCGTPFTWRRRRHHCRFCGLCVCDACSTGRIKAPGFSTARPAAATGAAYMVQEGLRAPARVGEQPTPPTVGQELTINRTQKKQAVDRTHDKKLNFLCVAKLVLDEFPEMLRHLLRQKWNAMVERCPGVELAGWQRIEKSMPSPVKIGEILVQGVHGNTEDVVVSLGPGRFVLTRGGTLGNQPQLEFDREITSVMGKDQKVTITRGNRPGISGKLCWKKKKSKWILETDKNSQSEQVAKSIGSDELEFEEAFFSRKVTNTVFAECNCSKCHDRHEPNYAKVPAATNKLDELDAPVLVHELTRVNEGQAFPPGAKQFVPAVDGDNLKDYLKKIRHAFAHSTSMAEAAEVLDTVKPTMVAAAQICYADCDHVFKKDIDGWVQQQWIPTFDEGATAT